MVVSQKELAGLVGVTKEYLSMVINSKRDAGKKLADLLAKRTKTAPELWITGTREERKAAIKQMKDN